jgi:hypothetical protein
MEITEQNLLDLKKSVQEKIRHYGVSGVSRITGMSKQYLWAINKNDQNFSAEKAAQIMDKIKIWEVEREKKIMED